MTAIRIASLRVAVCVCLLATPPAFAQRYTAFEIKDAGAATPAGITIPTAINEAGVVIGNGQVMGNVRGYVFDRGALTQIPTFGGSGSVVDAINSIGDVVGRAQTPDGRFHAYFWRAGSQTRLTPPGFQTSHAVKMNDAGEVIGSASDGTRTVAFFSKPSANAADVVLLEIDPGASSVATDINQQGVVVGYGKKAGIDHAFVFDGRTGAMRDLGTFGGVRSYASAINDSGDVAGYFLDGTSKDVAYVLLKDPATFIPILTGTLGSYAQDISENGQVYVRAYDGSNNHALLYSIPDRTLRNAPPGFDYESVGHLTADGKLFGTYAYAYEWRTRVVPCGATTCSEDYRFYYYRAFAAIGDNSFSLSQSGPSELVGFDAGGVAAVGIGSYLYTSRNGELTLVPPDGATQMTMNFSGINTAGVVVGRRFFGAQAFRSESGQTQLIASLVGKPHLTFTNATHITDSGHILAYGTSNGAPALFVIIFEEDIDGDAVIDAQDNCPVNANPTQSDVDLDGIGDACDPDSTKPVIEPIVVGTRHAGTNWYTSDIQLSWLVTDGESAISSTVGCATTPILDDTAGITFGCTATSAGGTATASVTLMRDTIAPEIAVATPASGLLIAVGGVSHASYSCSDAASGIATCAGPVASGAALDTSSAGTMSFTITASDAAGNTATRTITYSVVDSIVDGRTIRQWYQPAAPSRHLLVYPDGQLMAQTWDMGSFKFINATTGATTPFVSPTGAPGTAPNPILFATPGESYLVGSWQYIRAHRRDGSLAWAYTHPYGCCNNIGYPFLAADRAANRVLASFGSQLFSLPIDGGAPAVVSTGGQGYGVISATREFAYTAGANSFVTKWRLTGAQPSVEWSRQLSQTTITWNFSEGAITRDGAFVVTRSGNHGSGYWNGGDIWRAGELYWISADAQTRWEDLQARAVTPPVIDREGRIYVGAVVAPAPNPQSQVNGGVGVVRVYGDNGELLWTLTVPGLPHDLLVGDDGNVYVAVGGAGATGEGRILAVDATAQRINLVIERVPAPWEIVLRDGVIYASGDAGVTAIQLPAGFARNYDPESPWPVRQYDNQRSSQRVTTSQMTLSPVTTTYGGSAWLSAVLTAGGQPVVGAAINFVMRGVPVGVAVTDAAGVATLSVPTGTVNAGTYEGGISAVFAGTTAIVGVQATAPLIIGRAQPVLSLTADDVTYDGQPHGATATVTGVFGEDLAPMTPLYALSDPVAEGPPDPTEEVPIDAGRYDVTAAFAGNVNYLPAARGTSLTISPAVPGITILPVVATYDGATHSAHAYATGVLGEDLGQLATTYEPAVIAPVDAGSYLATAQYAGSRNYSEASASSEVVINRAASRLTVTGGDFVYDGQPHAASASATGILDESLGDVVLTYSSGEAPINAGHHVVTASYPGSANYESAEVDAAIDIARAVPIVAVTGGSFNYDGVDHGATATVTGVLGEDLGTAAITYSPGGAVPHDAGQYMAIASFQGSSNYEPAEASGSITIERGGATLIVNGVSTTYDGQPHAATGSVTGVNGEDLGPVTFTYNGLSHVPVHAGTYDAVGSFGGNANYNATSATTVVHISQAALTIGVEDATRIYGVANPAFALTYQGLVSDDTPAVLSGAPQFQTAATAASPVGAYPVLVSGLTSSDYAITFEAGTLVIGKEESLLTLSSSSNPAGYQQAIALTATVIPAQAGSQGAASGAVAFTMPDGTIRVADILNGVAVVNTIVAPGTHTITARYAGDLNLNASQSQLIQVVNDRQLSTTTDLKLPSKPVSVGEPITFDVTVTGASTGWVQLLDGGIEFSKIELTSGRAFYTATYQAAGTHVLEARFISDTAPSSISPPVVFTVLDGNTLDKTTVRLTVDKKATGELSDITAVVTGNQGVPTGAVSFYLDGGPAGTATLVAVGKAKDAEAIVSKVILPGVHALTAIYAGSSTHAGSSTTIEITVGGRK